MSVIDLKRLDVVDLSNMSLNLVGDTFDRYVVFPSPEARDAVVLWCLHTHVFESFYITPRLNVFSTEPGSGKSLVLQVLSYLTPDPLLAVNVTPGVIWHLLEDGNPTIFIDEADTVFGRHGSSSSHSILQSILNAGYQRGAKVPRLYGKGGDVKWFNVHGPIALAGIGQLPDALRTRTIPVAMRRRKPADPEVEEFDPELAGDELERVRGICEMWACRAADPLKVARPDVPADNRDAQLWRPLVAIGDLAGDPWPARSRRACKVLTAQKEPPVGLALLADIRTVFGFDFQLPTAQLVTRLRCLPKSPWRHGTFDGRVLAKILKEYGVKSTTFRPEPGADPVRGYQRDDFAVAWDHHLDDDEEPEQ